MPSKNQIRKIFEDIATNHWMIHGFGYGDTWEMTEVQPGNTKVKYPLLYVVPQRATFPKGGINHNYDIYVFDQVIKGENNEMDVESDTFKIVRDIVSLLNAQRLYQSFTLDRNTVTVEAVRTEHTQDELTGHHLKVTLVEKFNADSCAVAGAGFGEDVPPSDCSPATITINGVQIAIVSSGDTENIVVKDTNGDVVDGEVIGGEYIVPASGGSSFSLEEYLELQYIYE